MDLSALGIKVTSSGVVKTTNELTGFSKAASAARQAARTPINVRVGNTGIAKALADIQKLDRALKGMGKGSSSARLNATGGAAAIREINRFAKAVTDARSKVGGGITVTLKANGGAAAIKSIQTYEKAISTAQASASKGANFNMSGGGNAGGMAAGIGGLTKALLGLVTVTGALAAGRYFLKLADESALLTAKLRLATAETGQFSVAMADVQRIAAATLSDLDTTATLYQRLMLNSKALGLSQKEVAQVTENVANSFRISGASTVEATQSTRQLIQALQSGVLRGDEFNSVMESAPRLAQALADGLGVPVQALRQMAEEGEITSEAITQAILKSTDSIKKESAGLPVTFSAAMGQIYNAAVITFGAFDQGGEFSKTIANFVIGGSRDFTSMAESAKQLGRSIRVEIVGLVAGFKEFGDAVKYAFSWVTAIANSSFGGWVGRVISQLNTVANAMNPVIYGLRLIKSLGGGNAGMAAKREETGRQNAQDVADRITREFQYRRSLDQTTVSANRATSASDKLGKSTKATGGGMSEAAKKAEEWAKALEKLRVDVAVSVSKQAEELTKAADDRLKKSDDELDNILKGINAEWEGNQRVIDAKKTWAEYAAQEADKERQKALNAAYTIADIIGGAWGDLVGTIADAVIPLIDVTSKLGKTLEAFSKGAAIGGSVGKVTGSSTGGAIGGGLGQIGGEAIAGALGKLGAFAGPLGAIAGGLIGGLIGGMLKKTPRASATISIIAGEAMDTAITGSSAKLKKAAGQMADGVIDGLLGLADQLGAQLVGDAKISIGMRKDKYRVDPTGQGITKTSKGAIDFGEDQGAAIAYAMQLAIQQGVLGGLSESMKRLIMADGDLQTQISKAMSFKGVFDELAQKDDPAKWAQDQVTLWRAGMDKIFKEAGATGEELAELERLTGMKRAEAAKDASKRLQELEQQRADLQISLLSAQGRGEEALALARQKQIDQLDATLRPMQEQIFAEAVLAAQREKAASLANQEAQLTIQIMELEGRAAEALALARSLETASADASLKPLYDRIHALQDAAAAEELAAQRIEKIRQNAQLQFGLLERLAGAQGDTATVTRLQRENELRLAGDALTRSYLLQIYAAEDLAAVNAEIEANRKRIDDERYGLEGRLLELQGNTAALRQRELDTLDPANRALLEMIFSLTDLAVEADAAKVAADALADAQGAIADEIDGLTRQWLELTGQTQTLRGMDLELLKSDEARELQQRIWNYQDALERQKVAQEAATTAMDDYNQRLDDARSVLVSAYESESSALQSTIDKFRDFSSAIREFRDGLIAGVNPGASLAQAQSRFAKTSSMARFGNEASLGAFTGDAQSYLDAARDTGTFEQYQQALAAVLSGSNSAIKGADGVASMAEKQLNQMTAIVNQLGLLREDNITFYDALASYNQVLNEEVVPYFANVVTDSISDLTEVVDIGNRETKQSNEKTQITMETLVLSINQIARTLSRASRDTAIAVTLDGETVPVTVGNVPLPVTDVGP